jgi:hypothetical protein
MLYFKEIIYYNFCSSKVKAFCLEFLKCLQQGIHKKPNLWKKKQVLHHDTVPSNTALFLKATSNAKTKYQHWNIHHT